VDAVMRANLVHGRQEIKQPLTLAGSALKLLVADEAE
jgi:hypothetical protein